MDSFTFVSYYFFSEHRDFRRMNLMNPLHSEGTILSMICFGEFFIHKFCKIYEILVYQDRMIHFLFILFLVLGSDKKPVVFGRIQSLKIFLMK